jgi:desampylase
VLVGRPAAGGSRVTSVVRCANADPAPRRRYAIDALDLLRAIRRARAGGEEVVGFYHSHPDAPPLPSAADLADAFWPGHAYLIAAVAAGRAGEVRAYRLSGGGDRRRFEPVPLAGEGP